MKVVNGEMLHVQLFGENQLQRQVKHPLKPIIKNGELFVIAGDDKDSYGDAWFVVISLPDAEKETPKDKKPPAPSK